MRHRSAVSSRSSLARDRRRGLHAAHARTAAGRTTPPRRSAGRRGSRRRGVLTIDGTGPQYNLGQDLRPGLADQTFTVSAFKREIELNGPADAHDADPHAELRLLPGPAGADAGPGRGRRGRLQRRRQRHADARLGGGGRRSPRRALPPSAACCCAPRWRRREALGRSDRGRRAAGRRDHRRRTDHAGGRRRRPADAHPVARLAHQPGRRGPDDHASPTTPTPAGCNCRRG